jgi:hypothetical protein
MRQLEPPLNLEVKTERSYEEESPDAAAKLSPEPEELKETILPTVEGLSSIGEPLQEPNDRLILKQIYTYGHYFLVVNLHKKL